MRSVTAVKKYVYIACILFLIGGKYAFAEELKAKAEIFDSQGKNVGQVLFTQNNGGPVTINLNIHSFVPGEHAFHIHENPACKAPDFKSAGGHFNPYRKKHGFLNNRGQHAGDLPNISVDRYGNCEMSFVTSQISLSRTKRNSLFKKPGTSVVIHEMPDDYFTEPAGKGGRRIACGLVK